MKQKKTLSTILLRTKNVRPMISAVLMLAFSNPVNAQNTSYNANTIPIGGSTNCAFGLNTLASTTSGYSNTACGYAALRSNTTGSDNTAIGINALYRNTTGYRNTACGTGTLYNNTTGWYNVAYGNAALSNNTTGNENTANGNATLLNNTTGSNNTANGSNALYSNTTGHSNAANGANALLNNTSGNFNTATGTYALYANTVGFDNVANGGNALYANTTGSGNVANGFNALRNSTGNNNAANGHYALYSNSTGTNNTGLGFAANVSAGNLTNATALGSGALVNASNKVRIGNAAVTVIEGAVPFTGSDARFKTDVKEEDVKGLEFIKKLRPVVYNFDAKKLTELLTKNMPDSIRQIHLNQDFSQATAIRQSGFIAQEVEKAAKETSYDFHGVHIPENTDDYYSLAYGTFVVPLVKGMQEQQKIIETLQQQVDELMNKQASTTSLNETSMLDASMEQNVPNPFSHETVIKFNLPQQIINANMNVYDLSGKQLKSLPISQRGASSLTITADQLSAGMYIYSIVADGKIVSSKRMVVADK